VICDCFSARALWALGDPDGALARVNTALAFAKELAQPRSWVLAAHFAAQLHQLRGEPLLARNWAREVVRLADEYGMDFWIAFGDIDLGWAEAELDDLQQGIERMQQGLRAHMATGAMLWCPHFLGLLAEQLAKAGRTEEGLDTLAKALSMAESSGEIYSMAELHRLKREFAAGCGTI
jgi:predicted ATPase